MLNWGQCDMGFSTVYRMSFVGFLLSITSSPSFANSEGVASEEKIERITVTGSRLQKAEYADALPIQVLVVDDAIKAGITSVGQLLHRASMAAGQQLDASYNANSGNTDVAEAPAKGGVGAVNIGLRGLEPERTLILVNGRRIGASGVRGAPSQPDMSLLPLNMVQRIEIISEGASSIYGADAVAGVINVIMKDDFDGSEFSVNASDTKDGGGAIRQFSFVNGTSGDKSAAIFSASYYHRERIKVSQRADGCIRNMQRDEAGRIYTECRNVYGNNIVLNFSDALLGPNGGDIFAFYTPGETNIGVPDFSTGAGLAEPNYDTVRIDGNGRNRYTYDANYHDQWDTFNGDLVMPTTQFTLATNGWVQTDFLGADEQLFYEAYYFHRHLTNQGASEQHIPTIAGLIPHEDENGNLVRNEDGSLDLVDNPLNPFTGDATLGVTIDALSQKRDVELDHVRFVVGLRGDFASGLMAEKAWGYDMHVAYDRGMGHQSQPVLHEEHLFISNETLRLDVNGNPVCGLTKQSADYGGILSLKECVVVDWFAPNIFSLNQKNGGRFGSDEERDYLIATRTNRTVVEQVLVNAFVNGELFDFDGGSTAVAAFGVEYRKDDIWSAVDYLGATGGNAAINPLTESATNGSRSVNSAYAEVSLPIWTNQLGIDLLELELAVRFTDESNFGNKTTYRNRLTYKPVDSVILSASYGTSFRAPNLREQFLGDQQQGASGFSDPCAVPDAAKVSGAYDASKDTRPQMVLDNCILSGADPTSLGINGVLGIPVTVGGNVDNLAPETSTSMTFSAKWNPELAHENRLNLAFTYFDFEIENLIRSIDGATIMSRCYNEAPNLASSFCRLVRRDNSNIAELNFISSVDASFLNVGLETSKGFDVNIDYATSFADVFGHPLSLMWSNQYSQMLEREIIIFAGDKPEDLLQDFGHAKHRLVSSLNFTLGDFDWMLIGRYLSGTHADDTTAITASCDRFVESSDLVLPDGSRPNVQPICQAGGAFYLDTSVSWNQPSFRVTGGINNVFDKKPPLVAMDAGSNRANMVTSSGYDQFGQTIFLNLAISF